LQLQSLIAGVTVTNSLKFPGENKRTRQTKNMCALLCTQIVFKKSIKCIHTQKSCALLRAHAPVIWLPTSVPVTCEERKESSPS
jgi:hypothetical protein